MSRNSWNDKNKLVPTDVGIVVNDFLMEYFPEIMDYNFTANVEKDFDAIAEGQKNWTALMKNFYEGFEPQVEKTLAIKTDHKVGERILGNDPATGLPVMVKIGRYGPMAQIGDAGGEEKPRFATLKPGQSIETISLQEVLDLFKLPRTLGEFEGKNVVVGAGRFGPYVQHDGKYVSIPKEEDPLAITLEQAEDLIEAKRKAEAERHIKSFGEDPDMEILNGRYGPYISYKKKNFKLPKEMHERAKELTHEECMKIIEEDGKKRKRPATRRTKAS